MIDLIALSPANHNDYLRTDRGKIDEKEGRGLEEDGLLVLIFFLLFLLASTISSLFSVVIIVTRSDKGNRKSI